MRASCHLVAGPHTDWEIFSCACACSLKWKPPSENSIDFLLQLKFPARTDHPNEPDFLAKPMFMLMMNHGHEGNHYFDIMEVPDDTWEE